MREAWWGRAGRYGCPRNDIVPVVGGRAPDTRLTKVVLPAPLGPIRPWMVPAMTARSTASSARIRQMPGEPTYLEGRAFRCRGRYRRDEGVRGVPGGQLATRRSTLRKRPAIPSGATMTVRTSRPP